MRSYRSLFVLLVGFAALTVGCAGSSVESLDTTQALSMTPGSNASTAFTVDEADVGDDVEPADVTAATDGDGLEASLSGVQADDEGGLSGWLNVSAAEDASEGEHAIDVAIGTNERRVPVTVETSEDPLGEGDVAQLTFTVRATNGEIVLTNDEEVANTTLPRSAVFQEPRSFQPTPVQLSNQSRLPAELVDGLTGLGVNQTRTIHVSEFFGPETVEETRDRGTTVNRTQTVPTEVGYPPQQAQQVLPRDAQQGDEVDLPVAEDGRSVPYVMENMSRQQVSFTLALDVNETFTLHEPWPDAAQVTNVSDEEATVRVTPDAEEGQTLTWNEDWGNVTEIVAYGEDEIRLRHSPSEGLVYEQTDPQSQRTIRTEVVEVTEDEIVVERTNPHPLAGQTVVFDVTVADRGRPQQPSIQPQG